ncbi:MAG: hypothetical protein K6F35_11560 [Lachnospiraceae bacterium]|nr:hypothetical protein [Lachnospiraceae bacterium]
MNRRRTALFIGISLGVVLILGGLALFKAIGNGGQDALKRPDADILLGEALEGTGCKADFEGKKGIDSENYYIYTVKDSEGGNLSRLAVNAASGDISVYDPEAEAVEDFSQFERYDQSAASAGRVDWDGTYEQNGMTVSLLPSDESSFEFTIRGKDGAEFIGVARSEGSEAEYQDEEETIRFVMGEEGALVLTETGSLHASGTYQKK